MRGTVRAQTILMCSFIELHWLHEKAVCLDKGMDHESGDSRMGLDLCTLDSSFSSVTRSELGQPC